MGNQIDLEICTVGKVIRDNQVFLNNTENRDQKGKEPASFNRADSKRNVNLSSVEESENTSQTSKTLKLL